MKRLKNIDLAIYFTKVNLPFPTHIRLELIVKRVWAGVVKVWMTYREMIRDAM